MELKKIAAKLAMINVMLPQENLLVGGQPTPSDLVILQQMGVKQVINLRPDYEQIDYDERAICQQLQMQYHVVPVDALATLNLDNAKRLHQLLTLNQPTLVHCASGNRVGALIALMAYWLLHYTAEDAYHAGVESGLTKLKPEIKQLLGLASN